MTLVIKSEDDTTRRKPHLALTHSIQGGAANGRNVSLLMKSVEVTEAIEKALEGLGLESSVVKAAYYGQIRSVLQVAVSEQFGGDGWDEYAYVEDFNDTSVVFCTPDGLFTVGYTLSENGTVAKLDDVATPVTSSVVYLETDGDIKLSDDAEDLLEEGVYKLVKSCTQNPSTIEHLQKMFSAKETKMNEEIQKAVDAAVAIEKAAFTEQSALLKAATDRLAELDAAAAVAVQKARAEALTAAGVVADSVEALVKSFAPLDDAAFAGVVASYAVLKAAAAESDLFAETGVSGAGEADATEVDRTEQILKAKYGKQ
jgi:hypothetical protein